jgi:hypothetical protein
MAAFVGRGELARSDLSLTADTHHQESAGQQNGRTRHATRARQIPQ